MKAARWPGVSARLTKETALCEGGQGLRPGEGTRVCVLGMRADSGDLWAPDHVQHSHRSKHKSELHPLGRFQTGDAEGAKRSGD